MLLRAFWALCFCFLWGELCESNDAFQFLEKTIDPCAASCTEKPLAYKGFDRKSCVRGCRLFAVCEWNTDNLTEACGQCKSACDEAYQNNDETKDACYNGCNNALPLAQQRNKKIEEQSYSLQKQLDSFPSLFDMNDPFDMELDEKEGDDTSMFDLDSLMNEMMKHAMLSFQKFNGFMSSSHHTEIIDIKDENGEQIIIIQHGGPQMNTPHPNDKKIVLNTGSEGFKTTLKDFQEHLESNLQTNVNSEWDYPKDMMIDYNDNSDQPCCCSFRKWWNCVRQRDCLAELALIMFWVSVTFVMLIACCIPQRPKKKLSVNGDLAFITDSKGSLPDYAKPYPAHEDAKKSPYYLASVVAVSEEKVPLP